MISILDLVSTFIMSVHACCDAPSTLIHKAYLKNNGRYLRRNSDGTLIMVDKKDATWFYIYEYCSSADQRIHFHVLNNKDDINGSFNVNDKINEREQIILNENDANKNITNFWIKYYLHKTTYELDKVSFVMQDTGYKDSNGKYYAFDNFGDGRVVWFETNGVKNGSLETKENQQFKVIYIEKDI